MFYEYDGEKPVVGEGTYISETAIIIGNVQIGNHCYIGHGAILRGDYGKIEIADEVTVEEGVIIHAPPGECCSVGKGVVFGHGAIIHAKSVGENVGVGMGAILSVYSSVELESVVAEGAVVKRSQVIPKGIVAAGNPAKKMRDIFEKDREFWAYTRKVYRDVARKYLETGMRLIELP